MTPLRALQRFLVYLVAIAAWIALWVGAMAVGLPIGLAIMLWPSLFLWASP